MLVQKKVESLSMTYTIFIMPWFYAQSQTEWLYWRYILARIIKVCATLNNSCYGLEKNYRC